MSGWVELMMTVLVLNLGNPSWHIRHDLDRKIEKDDSLAWIEVLSKHRESRDLEIRFRIQRLLNIKIKEKELKWFSNRDEFLFEIKEKQILDLIRKEREVPNWFKKKQLEPFILKNKELGFRVLSKILKTKEIPYMDLKWCINQLADMGTDHSTRELGEFLRKNPTSVMAIGAMCRSKKINSLRYIFEAYVIEIFPNKKKLDRVRRVFWSWDGKKSMGWKSIPQIYAEAFRVFPKKVIVSLGDEISAGGDEESQAAFVSLMTEMREK